MTIEDLREIATQSGLAHAEFCLEQHTTQIGREAAEPLWLEMSALTTASAHDGLDDLPATHPAAGMARGADGDR